MVRSAAKNHRHVGVVTDPADYGRVLDALQKGDGALDEGLRRELALKAFALTARYDAAIARWLFEQRARRRRHRRALPARTSPWPGAAQAELRYGENPHQQAAFYVASQPAGAPEPSVATAEVLNGKALSYNNLVDLDAALALAKEFDEPFVAVHQAQQPLRRRGRGRRSPRRSRQAWAGDPLSAFGSVLAFTRPVDLASAEFLVAGNRFVEAIVAPAFDAGRVRAPDQQAQVGQERAPARLRPVRPGLAARRRASRCKHARRRLPAAGPRPARPRASG